MINFLHPNREILLQGISLRFSNQNIEIIVLLFPMCTF